MDWDQDGRLDLIVGDRPGFVHFFRRMSYGDIYLQEERPVTVAGEPIDVGLNSSPCVTYWDADSLPDLVVGRMEGMPSGVLLYLNRGIAGEPVFNRTDTVWCDGGPIELYAAYPDMGDLTGDGLEDMIVGSTSGEIPCYINQGSPGNPVFLQYSNLRADGDDIDFNTYVRPSICDWNRDSIPDLLASTYDGTIHLFLGQPETGVSDTSITAATGIQIIRYGNPVSSLLYALIRLQEDSFIETDVYSLQGRRILSIDHGLLYRGEQHLDIDVSRFPSGIYYFTCKSGTDEVSASFVVLHP